MTPQTDIALSRWCTLEVGGPARWFCDARDESTVLDALGWAEAHGTPVCILGGGSNVVVADEGFDGLVIRIAIGGLDRSASDGRVRFSVGAGEPWDPVVSAAVEEDCAGLECLSGIPGLVGGTPVQNVGAYGQDVSSTIEAVHTIDRTTGQMVRFPTQACGFAYRTSRFKRNDRFIVTRVDFDLVPGGAPTVAYADVVSYFQQRGEPSPTLGAVREAILQIRRRKGMVIEPGNPANRSVGSFFVNPIVPREHLARIAAALGGDVAAVPHYPLGESHVKIPAAWLIERAGFPKGYRRGAVGLSPFQALALVNHGGATAADLVALAGEVKQAVRDRFAIALVPEPVFVGFRPSPALAALLDPHAAATLQ